MFKKLLAILLACLMLIPGGIAMAEEAEALTSGDYEYTLNDDGSASITDYSGKAEALIVPAELDGHSVTSIGDKAFYDCEFLTTITLPDSVTSIGNYAFFWCTSLTAITLPDSVTTIGANPFTYCKQLTQITVSPDHPTLATIDGVLFEKATQTLICYPCAFTTETYAVPQGIQAIGDRAFSDCESLTAITLPDSVTSIGDEAFYDCAFLTAITLPDSVTSIGENAFVAWRKLTLTVPRDSYALAYAKENGIPYTYTDSMDWLNG